MTADEVAPHSADAVLIGVTGHRPNRLVISESALEGECERLLRALAHGVAETSGAAPIALSALAEGADSAFARAALAIGLPLSVLLPMAQADYETTFAAPSSAQHLRALLGQARWRSELPGDPAAGAAPYVALQEQLIRQADFFFVVWDGAGAAGAGGTPEVADAALSRGVRCLWIDAKGAELPKLSAPEARSLADATWSPADEAALRSCGKELSARRS